MQIGGGAFALVHRIHSGSGRTTPAGIHDLSHPFRWTGEKRLDRAVTPVAHPSFETRIESGPLHEVAVPHSLNPAADKHMAHHIHATSPTSVARAPPQPEGAQRASEQI
jgi:hypothetical protein